MARPRKLITDRRDRKIVLWVSDREHARFLINAASANLTTSDFARRLLCREAGAVRTSNDNNGTLVDREVSFASIDALNRLGASVDQVLRIAQRTGHLPHELDAIAHKVDALLDRLLPP